MRYYFFLCVTLLSGIPLSFSQTAPTPAPSASKSDRPGFGIYTHVQTNAPYLAMTFDDGPSAEYTPRLLDMLKARHIKATFFLIGKNVQAHPELVRRIIAEGHEVGNHTWDHPQLSKLTDAQATDEIEKTQNAIRAACGVTPTLLRPPYGALNKPEHFWIPQELKLNVIYWTVDTEDWKRPGAATLKKRIFKRLCSTRRRHPLNTSGRREEARLRSLRRFGPLPISFRRQQTRIQNSQSP